MGFLLALFDFPAGAFHDDDQYFSGKMNSTLYKLIIHCLLGRRFPRNF